MHEPAGPVTPLIVALVTRPLEPATLTWAIATPPGPPLPQAATSPLTEFIADITWSRDGLLGKLESTAGASAVLDLPLPLSAPSSRSSIDRGPLGLLDLEGSLGSAAPIGSLALAPLPFSSFSCLR